MRLISSDNNRPDSIRLGFDAPVGAREVADYLAGLCKEVLEDDSIYVEEIGSGLRDINGFQFNVRYHIKDDSEKNYLFDIKGMMEEPKVQYWASVDYHAGIDRDKRISQKARRKITTALEIVSDRNMQEINSN